jgi:hypothetical protein
MEHDHTSYFSVLPPELRNLVVEYYWSGMHIELGEALEGFFKRKKMCGDQGLSFSAQVEFERRRIFGEEAESIHYLVDSAQQCPPKIQYMKKRRIEGRNDSTG